MQYIVQQVLWRREQGIRPLNCLALWDVFPSEAIHPLVLLFLYVWEPDVGEERLAKRGEFGTGNRNAQQIEDQKKENYSLRTTLNELRRLWHG
jgi:hypothetical protein